MAAAGGESIAPPPVFFDFTAPAAWRAVDFISDLHLSSALPRTQRALAAWLAHTEADAVFILGDLFEVWIGDDARFEPYESACAALLAGAARRITVGFMVGNRDFLLGAAMGQAAGLTPLPDPTVLRACGRRVLLTHGDALCLADTDYQAFRRDVRSAAWQQAFLARPLAERAQVAAGIRARSEERKRFDGRTDIDIDFPTTLQWMQASGSTDLVHGHTHRPSTDTLAPGRTRRVLTDWDLDDAQHPRAEVLRLTADGFQRLPVQAT